MPPSHSFPPGIMHAGVDAALGAFDAVVRGTSDYWASAVRRRATPAQVGLDVLTWWTTALKRERPQWATQHEIVAEWPLARLRDFSDHDAGHTVATLLLPPQAGHDSCIVDFAPGQSQVRAAKDAGLSRVLSLDWIGATGATKNASVEDYLAVIAEAVERVGGRVNLVGDCQGGWLAVIYAALHPETVDTLTIAGAPVDFHAGEPLIHDWIRVLSPGQDLAFYRGVIDANGGVLPGEFLLGGFKNMQPHNELDRQLQLLAHINDTDHVARYRTFETWFQHTQPVAGGFYLWIVEHLFQKNELVRGSLRVGGRTVELGRITCPLNLLAGGNDHITPPPQVFALEEHAGTPAADVCRRLTSGGHLGLFMGHEALRSHWAPVFTRIAARSDMAPDAASMAPTLA
jgi:poly(3-hydroxybutyrate) depolymerase